MVDRPLVDASATVIEVWHVVKELPEPLVREGSVRIGTKV
jgi:hypothetical protein